MKKKFIFLAISFLICFIGAFTYRRLIITKTNRFVVYVEYVMKRQGILKFHKRVSPTEDVEDIMKGQTYCVLSQEGIQVEEIIKRTPSELVMIVRWGNNNERAYVSIKNWLTMIGDRMVIYPLDFTRRIVIYS